MVEDIELKLGPLPLLTAITKLLLPQMPFSQAAELRLDKIFTGRGVHESLYKD